MHMPRTLILTAIAVLSLSACGNDATPTGSGAASSTVGATAPAVAAPSAAPSAEPAAKPGGQEAAPKAEAPTSDVDAPAKEESGKKSD